MINLEKNKFLRHQKLTVSAFAKEHLQHVVEVGHFITKENNISHVSLPDEDTYLIFYMVSGQGLYIMNDEYHALIAGTTLILNGSEKFSISVDDSTVYYTIVHGRDMQAHFQKACHNLTQLDFRLKRKIEIYFFTIFSSLDKYEIIDEFALSSAIYKLYSDLYVFTNEVLTLSQKHDVIKDAVQYIEVHYADDIKLIDIACAVGYSEFYFTKLFKEIMKDTPYEYLIKRRLTQSKILMLSTRKTIQEISLSCGFKNESNFYSIFKKTYSITPKEFRKAMGG